MNKQPIGSVDLEINESSLAYKIFSAFVNDGQISLTRDELFEYVCNDLKIPEHNMTPGFKETLPVLVLSYLNMWSGWHFKTEFRSGKFSKEHYFQRFQKYMMFKMNFLSRTPNIKSPNKLNSESEFSSFAISIKCPPDILNGIVFSNSGDDIVMQQHHANTWQKLTTTQLLNWPHVQVNFATPDISFVRRQETKYERYLNFYPHKSLRNPSSSVESAVIQPDFEYMRKCISYDYLEKYLGVYLQVLKTQTELPATKYEEVQAILSQFLDDVKFINVKNSIATNTHVLFQLAPVPFVRNKKLVKNSTKEDEPRVGYCEIITPKIELLLLYFKAEQKNTPHLSFDYTDKIIQHPNSNIVPCISYECTFCNLKFTNYCAKSKMLTHLKDAHKMEQPVRCVQCKKQYDVLNLAACRWKHKCQRNNK